MWNILAFFLGIIAVCFVPALPDVNLLWLLPVLIACWIFIAPLRWLSSALLGALWLIVAAQDVLQDTLPESLISETITVVGRIHALPQYQPNRVRFLFEVENAWRDSQTVSVPRLLRLSWYSTQTELHANDRWQLTVRLKPASGLANPGVFDYERWLFENRITTTGYVTNKGLNQRLTETHGWRIDNLREDLRELILASSMSQELKPLVLALLIGDRSLVTPEQWQVLTATGTNHLLAISGLHIGLVAFFSYWLLHLLAKRMGGLLIYIPAYKLAAIGALLAAFGYAALAGFSIPTQRALIMIGLVLLLLLFNKRLSTVRVLGFALFSVLLYDPFAVLSQSFWLSFFAVAVIVYSVHGRVNASGWWWKWGRIQWLISIAMMPVLLFSFQSFSLVSPLANLVAVPWVSFLVVPIIFLAGLLSSITLLFDGLMLLIEITLGSLWSLLQMLASLPFSQVFSSVSQLSVLFMALLAVIMLIAPRGVPLRLPGLVLLMPLFFQPKSPIPGDSFTLYLLDVGQGLSAVIKTQSRVLVFDTGAKYSESFDMGKVVLTPFLRSQGISRIDTLLLSHGDNDHIGGTRSVIDNFEVGEILSSDTRKIPQHNVTLCAEGMRWTWDKVDFEILHPSDVRNTADNDNSCVLRVATSRYTLLLPGDIEKTAEWQLIENNPTQLDVDVLVAPHHGSKTSSTMDFIQATSPRLALFPAGYLNRFGFPKQEVVSRYEQAGSRWLSTGDAGAIQVDFFPDAELRVFAYREQSARFWNRQAN